MYTKIIVVFLSLMLLIMPFIVGDRASSMTQTQTPIKVVLGNARVMESTVAMADFNGDGYKEIVIGDVAGFLYVVSWTGASWNVVWSRQTNLDIAAFNPPTSTSDNNIRSSPVIADLDNDEHLEIVIGVGGDIHSPNLNEHRNGGILVYHYNNAWDFSLIEPRSPDGTRGWPQPCKDEVGWPPETGYNYPDGYWDGVFATPAVGDITGDGNLEIVYLGIDRFLYAWHYDGSLVEGWPIAIPVDGGLSSPALGDLNGDGRLEIVVGTMSPTSPTTELSWNEATVWAVKGDGTLLPGFPVRTEQIILSSPALGDLTGDGKLEIVVGSGYGTPHRQNLVYVWKHDGTPLPGWPQEAPGASVVMAPPALGDINNDGKLEIVVGCGNGYQPDSCDKLYVWNSNGSLMPHFPMQLPPRMSGYAAMPYSPVLADLNGDGNIQILMGRLGDWALTVVDPLNGMSNVTTYQTPGGLMASPIVDDINGNGFLDIVIGGIDYNFGNQRGAVYIWNTTAPASHAALPWPMFGHNYQRTARFTFPPKLIFAPELRLLHETGTGDTLIAYTTVRNGGEIAFDWNIEHNISRLEVLPAAGTVITGASTQLQIDVSGLADGWHDMGDLAITAFEVYGVNSVEVSGSPKVVPLYVYLGHIFKVYLPLVMRGQ